MHIDWEFEPVKALYSLLIIGFIGLGIYILTGNIKSWFAALCFYQAMDLYFPRTKVEVINALQE